MDIFESYNRYRCKLHFNRLKADIIAGSMPPPSKATIELTMRCNLACRMCFRDKEGKKELSLKELKKVFDGLPPSIGEVHLIGGEIFLRSDIFDILDDLDGRSLRIRIHSNGTLLNDAKIERLKGYKNLIGMGFSIDGTRELHNSIRGWDKAYDKTIEAITKMAALIPVSINTVLLDENFGQIEEVFAALKGLGIKEYRIEPSMFSTPSEISATEVGPLAVNERESESYGYRAQDLLELKKRLDTSAKDTGIRIVIAPRVAEIDAPEFFSGDIRAKKKLFCKHLLVPRIDSEGNLVHCHIIKKTFGNLLKNSFEELWKGKELWQFRRALLENNLYPVCKRCCRLRSI